MAWLDLTARVQTAQQTVFGESVSFTPSGSSAESVTGIFDAAHAVQELIGDSVVETAMPVVTLKISSLSRAPIRGDGISVRSQSYSVVEIKPDGHGDVLIVLEKA